MKCPNCKSKMRYLGSVDEHWKFYKCDKCGYENAKVIGVKHGN